MHGLVRELALQVYKTISNNIFKLGKYYTVREKLSKTSYIAQMQYMYDSSQTLFHTAILGGEWTVMKISTKCNRCDLFQTMSELSAWPACCHTD